eukprot:TRINITY_DN324_c0_g2_i1.p2 TRINITY_DN324_c0_g2~~TRINITY_DN324_c0_g2_i1.p2  ORF type:complete len:228 (-),score=15.95 TRINITY_DN324_c0_g2_i1:300-983(-)
MFHYNIHCYSSPQLLFGSGRIIYSEFTLFDQSQKVTVVMNNNGYYSGTWFPEENTRRSEAAPLVANKQSNLENDQIIRVTEEGFDNRGQFFVGGDKKKEHVSSQESLSLGYVSYDDNAKAILDDECQWMKRFGDETPKLTEISPVKEQLYSDPECDSKISSRIDLLFGKIPSTPTNLSSKISMENETLPSDENVDKTERERISKEKKILNLDSLSLLCEIVQEVPQG